MSDRDSPAPSSFKVKYDSTANDVQKRQLEKLMANPTKPAYVPDAPELKQIRPARDMMRNVMGSSAGAGSGEFHIYKHARRREYERLAIMEEEDKQKREKEAALARQAELDGINEARASKNKAKRDKKKARRGKGPAKDKEGGADEASDDDEPAAKKAKMAASGATLAFREREEPAQPAVESTPAPVAAASGKGILVVDEE